MTAQWSWMTVGSGSAAALGSTARTCGNEQCRAGDTLLLKPPHGLFARTDRKRASHPQWNRPGPALPLQPRRGSGGPGTGEELQLNPQYVAARRGSGSATLSDGLLAGVGRCGCVGGGVVDRLALLGALGLVLGHEPFEGGAHDGGLDGALRMQLF